MSESAEKDSGAALRKIFYESLAKINSVPAQDIPDKENVDLLLEKHQESIDKLQAVFPDIKRQEEWPYYDRLFFLRYILSFKKVEPAKNAIQKCIEWRKDNADLLANVPKRTFADGADGADGLIARSFKITEKYQCAAIWKPEAVADAGFLILVRGALGKTELLHDHLTRDENIAVQFAMREMAYRHCDAITRKTRRLSKQTMLFDVQGMSFSKMMDPKQQKVYGHASKISKFVYPQLVRKMCLVNAPKWMSIVLKVASAFLPKSTMEKIEVFSSLVCVVCTHINRICTFNDYHCFTIFFCCEILFAM